MTKGKLGPGPALYLKEAAEQTLLSGAKPASFSRAARKIDVIKCKFFAIFCVQIPNFYCFVLFLVNCKNDIMIEKGIY